MMICKKCNKSEEFYKGKGYRSGFRPICVKCQSQQRRIRYMKNQEENKKKQREWNAQYPNKVKEKSKKWNDNNKLMNRSSELKRNFGMTLQDYDLMFEQQRGRCKICNRHQSIFARKLFVDHCHKTGKVRGLLCSTCNSGIGHLQDNIKILQSAIEYLKMNL